MLARLGSATVLALLVVTAVVPAHAESRKPTTREVAAVRACATKTKDDVDAGEEKCLFKLVADPCMAPVGAAPDRVMADCFQIEGVIWDDLLNENYKSLLATLDDEPDCQGPRHAARLDRLPRHHLRLLRRQDPRHDGGLHGSRLRNP